MRRSSSNALRFLRTTRYHLGKNSWERLRFSFPDLGPLWGMILRTNPRRIYHIHISMRYPESFICKAGEFHLNSTFYTICHLIYCYFPGELLWKSLCNEMSIIDYVGSTAYCRRFTIDRRQSWEASPIPFAVSPTISGKWNGILAFFRLVCFKENYW